MLSTSETAPYKKPEPQRVHLPKTSLDIADALCDAMSVAAGDTCFAAGEAKAAAGLLQRFCTTDKINPEWVVREMDRRATLPAEEGGVNPKSWAAVKAYV